MIDQLNSQENLNKNLKKLTELELLKLIKQKSLEEKVLTLEVINLIREVDRRKSYLGLGYSSLFDYVTRELGYEEAAALRRISAARLIKDMPEIESKILEGSLSLSNVTQAHSFFRKEEKLSNKKLTIGEKKEILIQLENKSARECQKTLLSISPEQIILKESQRVVAESHTEIKFVINDELKNKLDKLKLILSHQSPQLSLTELINKLADMALGKFDLAKNKNIQKSVKPTSPQKSEDSRSKFSSSPSTSKVQSDTTEMTPSTQKRYIPAQIKREVWQRDNSQCTFIDPITKTRCNSRYQLEIHHEKPFAMGGENSSENLKLLCKQHNTYQAVQDYGLEKIKIYRPSLTS